MKAEDRRRSRPALIDPDQFYSVEDYAALTDQCLTFARRDVKSGGVRARRDGRRIRILGAWIIERNRTLAAEVQS